MRASDREDWTAFEPDRGPFDLSASRHAPPTLIFLDLGDALFSLDLDMTVSASTGAPTRIAGSVGNLNIPAGTPASSSRKSAPCSTTTPSR
jgi:hypothetical protein